MNMLGRCAGYSCGSGDCQLCLARWVQPTL
jgi:hypothetical protein